jgi:hypothetical protein
VAIALLAYSQIIRPNQDAQNYTTHLSASSKPLQKCFEQLADTTGSKLFYAPDIPIDTKLQDTTMIQAKIKECRYKLDEFDIAAHHLAGLHLAGYTNEYRQSKIYQRQAYDIVGQSTDVLDQYNKTASFLGQYFNHIAAFNTYITSLQKDGSYFGSARLTAMEQQADDLRARATTIRGLDAPQEYNKTKQVTADMLVMTADGLDLVVRGYRQGLDTSVTAGYKKIDTATASYDSTIVNMPFDQLIKSYIPKQVMQLPAKIDNLLTASSE